MVRFPVLKSMRTTMIFNLGSVAFGALIIAIIQFIRLVLEYVDKKTRQLQQQSKIAEWAMCYVRCCMWCLEKIVAFINRNAFILVAGECSGCGAGLTRGVWALTRGLLG
jgi:choline transporter-like protein 2/4/5